MNSLEIDIKQTKDDIFRCLEEMASIKEQISRASAKARSQKIYSDVDWFHSAKRALKHKQIDHQKLQGRLSELNKLAAVQTKEPASTDSRNFERAFMHEAKMFLSGATYEDLLRKTRLALDIQDEKS